MSWVRRALALVVVLLALVALIFVGLHLSIVRQAVLAQLRQSADREGFELEAANLDYNLLTGDVSLESIVVRAKGAADPSPLFRADHLELDLSLSALLGKRLVIEDGTLANPHIGVIYLADGGANLPIPPDGQVIPEEPNAEPIDWAVRNFSVQNGSLLLEDRNLPAGVSLSSWSLKVSGGDDGRMQLTFTSTGPASVTWQEQQSEIGNLEFQGSLSDSDLDLSDIQIDLPTMGVSGVGVVAYGGDSDELSATFDVNAEASRVSGFLELDQDIEGSVAIGVQASGSMDEIALAVTARSESFRYGTLDDMELDAESTWSAGASVIDLPKVDIRTAFGEIDARGQLAIGEGGASNIVAAVRGLRLSRLKRQFSSPIEVASTATGSAELNWQGASLEELRSSLAGVADLRLSPTLASPRQDTLPVGGSVRLAAANGGATIALRSVVALGTAWTGTVRADGQDRLAGQVAVSASDIGASYALLQAFLGGAIDPETPMIAGSIDGTVDIAGTAANPQVSASLAGDGIAVGEIRDAAVAARASYANDEVIIETASLAWADQGATLQGRVQLDAPEPVYSLAWQVDSLDVGAVRSVLANETPIDGVVAIQGSMQGTLDAPSGHVSVSGDSFVAYGQPFGALSAELELSDGVARLDSLRLVQSVGELGGELSASGDYRLEDGIHSLRAEGRSISLEQLQISENEKLGGSLSFDVNTEGTLADPQLRGDALLVGASYSGRQLGDLNLDLSTQANRIRAEIRAEAFGGTVIADVGLAAPHQGNLRATLDDTDLAKLGLHTPRGAEVEGSVTATLTAEGEIDNWRDATARLTVRDANVRASGRLALETAGDVVIRHEGRTLFVDAASISAGRSTFSLSGELPLEQPNAASVMSVRGDLDLNELVSFVPFETPIGASGRLELDAAISGTLMEPVPQGEVRLVNAAVFSEAIVSPLTALNGTVRLVGGTVELESLNGDWSGARLSLTGNAPLALFGTSQSGATPEPFRVDWSLDGLVVNSLSALPRRAAGTISLGGHLEGSSTELDALTGAVEVSELALRYNGISISQTQPSVLRLDGGELTVERFDLQGPNLTATLTGKVQLQPEIALDFDLAADTNAAVLAQAVDRVSANGDIRLRVSVRGTLAEPDLTGELTWLGGEVASTRAGLAAQEIDLKVALRPGIIAIEKLTGMLNGGSLDASGNIGYEGMEIRDVDLRAKADGLFLEIPEGLRTVSNADLTIKSRDDTVLVGGRVEVEEGIYREPLAFDRLLIDLLRGTGGATEFVTEPNALLARTRFDIEVESLNPIIVDNNIAKLGATLDLRLTGGYYRPGLTGRVALEEGGELYVSENRYFVDRGVIDFFNENRIQPTVDVLARTQVQGKYDIELALTGGGAEPVETQLTSSSHQELGEPDLISLLLTGRLREDLRGEEVNVAAEQSLSYLTGRIGGRLSRAAQDTLGLSEVRIEPNLIAAESDPGARLTVGQSVSPSLSLVYSMNLADSSDQIWTVRYDVTRRFQLRGVRQADDTIRTDLQHDLRFGGGPDAGRVRRSPRVERLIGTVTISGDSPLPEDEIRSHLKVKTGQRYDFFEIRKGSDKLERMLHRQGHLEAKVSIARDLTGSTANLHVTIEAGPQLQLIYEGWSPSGSLQKQVRQLWEDGVFDAQRLDDVRRAILIDLTSRGYLTAEFRSEVSVPAERQKRVLFEIHPNTRFQQVELAFEGATEFSDDRLRQKLKLEGLSSSVYVAPGAALDFLTDSYRAVGYLDVQVLEPRHELDEANRSARVVVPISQGPQYHVSEFALTGHAALPDAQLRRAAKLPADSVFSAAILQDIFLRIEEEYWRAGYQDVELEFQVEKSESSPTVRIELRIDENRQSVVDQIQVAGVRATSEKMALSQLGIAPGKPLNFEQSSRGRRALYNTGAYTLVDLKYEPVASDTAAHNGTVKPLVANLRLREVQPFQVRYGGFFDSDRGPGGILDFRNRNTFGSARVVGARLRADQEFREARVFFSQPLLRSFPLSTNIAAFVSREKRPGEFFDEIDDRRGFSVSQEVRWHNRYILNFGYRFEKLISAQDPPDLFFPDPIRLTVAPFTVSFTRETRDNILDASRGDFLSNAFEWAPTQLGGESSLDFVRYFGQYFRYFPLTKPSDGASGNRVQRSRWVYATAARVGLSRGLGGQSIPSAEKFFGGGGTTMRGFEDDTLGGTDFFGPVGGDAMFLLNNELRFPLRGMFGGVTFLDVGNVYQRLGDFSLTDLRESAGFGLRVRTPFFLLRADYGFKLDRRPGESLGQFFFSIGQAF